VSSDDPSAKRGAPGGTSLPAHHRSSTPLSDPAPELSADSPCLLALANTPPPDSRPLFVLDGEQSAGPPPRRPIPGCYWVEPGRLLAGEYAGTRGQPDLRRKLGRFLDAGFTFFLDLTQEGELEPYADTLYEEAAARGLTMVEHRRMPIPDLGVPAPQHMREILSTLHRALAQGHRVYVHCWGGIGRTATVVGCYLREKGMTPDQAFVFIRQGLQRTPRAHRRSPETSQQVQMVRSWEAAMRGLGRTGDR